MLAGVCVGVAEAPADRPQIACERAGERREGRLQSTASSDAPHTCAADTGSAGDDAYGLSCPAGSTVPVVSRRIRHVSAMIIGLAITIVAIQTITKLHSVGHRPVTEITDIQYTNACGNSRRKLGRVEVPSASGFDSVIAGSERPTSRIKVRRRQASATK